MMPKPLPQPQHRPYIRPRAQVYVDRENHKVYFPHSGDYHNHPDYRGRFVDMPYPEGTEEGHEVVAALNHAHAQGQVLKDITLVDLNIDMLDLRQARIENMRVVRTRIDALWLYQGRASGIFFFRCDIGILALTEVGQVYLGIYQTKIKQLRTAQSVIEKIDMDITEVDIWQATGSEIIYFWIEHSSIRTLEAANTLITLFRLDRVQIERLELDQSTIRSLQVTYSAIENLHSPGVSIIKGAFSQSIVERWHTPDSRLGFQYWYTNITYTDLWDTLGDGKAVKTITLYPYTVTWYKDTLQIGCEHHSMDEWRDFSDDEIQGMDEGALAWWSEHKERIFTLIEDTATTLTEITPEHASTITMAGVKTREVIKGLSFDETLIYGSPPSVY